MILLLLVLSTIRVCVCVERAVLRAVGARLSRCERGVFPTFLETPRLIRNKAQDARLGYISNAKPQKPKSRVLAPGIDVAISGTGKCIFLGGSIFGRP